MDDNYTLFIKCLTKNNYSFDSLFCVGSFGVELLCFYILFEYLLSSLI